MKKEIIRDVHTEHCCILHGCKYGKDDDCPVVTKQKPQSFPCERCNDDGINTLSMLKTVIDKKKRRCKYCGHIV